MQRFEGWRIKMSHKLWSGGFFFFFLQDDSPFAKVCDLRFVCMYNYPQLHFPVFISVVFGAIHCYLFIVKYLLDRAPLQTFKCQWQMTNYFSNSWSQYSQSGSAHIYWSVCYVVDPFCYHCFTFCVVYRLCPDFCCCSWPAV